MSSGRCPGARHDRGRRPRPGLHPVARPAGQCPGSYVSRCLDIGAERAVIASGWRGWARFGGGSCAGAGRWGWDPLAAAPRPERRREVVMGGISWPPDGPALIRSDWRAQRDRACPRLAEAGAEILGCLPGRSGLRRMLLRLAQLGDRRGQPDEIRGQGHHCGHGAIGVVADHSQEPGGRSQPVPLTGPLRDLPVGHACRAIVAVCGTAQRRVPDRPGRRMESGGRRPGRIGGRSRVSPGAAPDLLRGHVGLPGRVPVEQVPFRGGEPERSGAQR